MLEVVRAAESLAFKPDLHVAPKSPKVEHKTTTIVMSKHTLQDQHEQEQVQSAILPAVSVFIKSPGAGVTKTNYVFPRGRR